MRPKVFLRLHDLSLGTAPEEAKLRGLPDVIASDDPIAKLITAFDMRVTATGDLVSFEQRCADIRARYGDNHIVTQALQQALPRIQEIIMTVDRWSGNEPAA